MDSSMVAAPSQTAAGTRRGCPIRNTDVKAYQKKGKKD